MDLSNWNGTNMEAADKLAIVGAFVGFGVIHSLTAGSWLPDRLKTLLGDRFVEGCYRLAYNVISVITFLPVLVTVGLAKTVIAYRVPMPWSIAFLSIQLVGVGGLVWSALTIDLGRFIGLKQLYAYSTGQLLPLADEKLQIGGPYRFSRHPLYLFTLLALCALPTMTIGTLIFNICATLYFVIGSWFEERRLLRTFGKEYIRYQSTTPWLLPLPRIRS